VAHAERAAAAAARLVRVLALALCGASGGCGCGQSSGVSAPPAPAPAAADGDGEATAVALDWAAAARVRMVKEQIQARGVTDERVLAAMEKVPRHEFIPGAGKDHAYEDHPVPIGHGQTISQPYIVAVMTELAELDGDARVLEVGTGSGYQAAVLAEVAGAVYTVEIVQPLAERARALLGELGYTKVQVRHGDGYRGWPEEAPFDAILVTAAPPRIPEPLKAQLAVGGRLVIPVGDRHQELLVIQRTASGYAERTVFPVRFVPMTGEVQGAGP
jgi:protein-L-isoaspartate(D-aspartate) O-methyltransferase